MADWRMGEYGNNEPKQDFDFSKWGSHANNDSQVDSFSMVPSDSFNLGNLGGGKESGGMFGNFFQNKETGGGGWGMDAFNIAKGAFDVYGNMKKLKLAEDALDFKKDSFNKQYETQRKIVQADLDWRRKSRNDRLAGSGGERTVI